MEGILGLLIVLGIGAGFWGLVLWGTENTHIPGLQTEKEKNRQSLAPLLWFLICVVGAFLAWVLTSNG